jgi:predicted TIM-barrel enzyme
MAQAGADVVGAHIGVTAGGLTGAKNTIGMEEAAAAVQSMCHAAKKVNPDIIIITHGGPFKDPATAEYSIVHSDAVGYAAGSSGERLPTEKAVSEITKQYKKMKLK